MRFALIVALVSLPLAADAAELSPGAVHKSAHRWHVHDAPRPHVGYYWGHWGWRSGGTRHSWYGSSFAFFEPWW
jgi:hypothetical protein